MSNDYIHWNMDLYHEGRLRFFTETGFATGGLERVTFLSGGNVGIGTAAPGELLTVAGSISARDDIYLNDSSLIFSGGQKFTAGNITDLKSASGKWWSTHNTLTANSAQWGLDTADLANIIAASGAWNSTNTSVHGGSGKWWSAHNTLTANSGTWGGQADSVSNIATSSGAWNSTNTSVHGGSAKWWSAHNAVTGTSANWDIAYSGHSLLAVTSANWNIAYNGHSLLAVTSANWTKAYNSTSTDVRTSSGKWWSAHNTLTANSGTWDAGTTLAFKTISTTGQSDIVADSSTDT